MDEPAAAVRTRWPLVSVVIPAHNYGHYVGEAIDSALAQTHRALEVIVVDDGSQDHTPQVLAGFGDAVRSVRLDGRGVAHARNVGLRMATGDFVIFLDADDLLLPDAVRAMLAQFDRRPDVDVMHGRWYYCDVRAGTWRLDGNPHLTGDILRRVVFGNVAAIHAVMTRRRVMVDAGGFDTAVSYTADWEMWLRLAGRGHRFGFADQPVALYRVHSNSMAGKFDRAAHDIFYVLDKCYADPVIGGVLQPVKMRAYFTWHRYMAVAWLAQGDVDRAHVHLREAVRFAPGALRSADLANRVAKAIWRGERRHGQSSPEQAADRAVAVLAGLGSGSGRPAGADAAGPEMGAALMLAIIGRRGAAAQHVRAALRTSWRTVVSRDGLKIAARLMLPRAVTGALFGDGRERRRRPGDEAAPAMVRAVVHAGAQTN